MEADILLYIQDHIRNPVLTPIMKGITALGNYGIFWIVLTLVLLCFRETRKAAICSVIAMLLSFIINNLILKNMIARIRPYEVIDGLILLVEKEKDFSFPSGHAGVSFASSVAMYKGLPKWAGISLVILAVLIALSRLYVGVHYPTDVLAGTITGIICGLLGAYFGKKLAEKVQHGPGASHNE